MLHGIPESSRRRLLQLAGGIFVLGATWPLSRASATLTVTKDRPYWRFCNKCHVMFYTDANPNSCAAGGTHAAQGYQFRLPFDGQETSTAQRNWRCCNKCQAMFFNGYREKGRCPTGGGHVADNTFRYVLPHNVRGTPKAQTDWRFCNKCHAMFYDGYPAKGRCAAGGGHVAQGFNFVLPHSR